MEQENAVEILLAERMLEEDEDNPASNEGTTTQDQEEGEARQLLHTMRLGHTLSDESDESESY